MSSQEIDIPLPKSVEIMSSQRQKEVRYLENSLFGSIFDELTIARTRIPNIPPFSYLTVFLPNEEKVSQPLKLGLSNLAITKWSPREILSIVYGRLEKSDKLLMIGSVTKDKGLKSSYGILAGDFPGFFSNDYHEYVSFWGGLRGDGKTVGFVIGDSQDSDVLARNLDSVSFTEQGIDHLAQDLSSALVKKIEAFKETHS